MQEKNTTILEAAAHLVFPLNELRAQLVDHPAQELYMPAVNELYRKLPSRLEESAKIDQQLVKIEDDIRKLKIDFDIYFAGSTKRPPLEARARLESQIKRISDNRSMSYSQRYQLNTLVSRFTSYRELWRRTLKARGADLI